MYRYRYIYISDDTCIMRKYVCIDACMYACMYACIYACMYVYVCMHTHTYILDACIHMHINKYTQKCYGRIADDTQV